MPTQQDLTLATLFKAVEDGSFKRVVRRLTVLLNGLNTTLGQVNQASTKLQSASKKASTALNQQAQAAKKASTESTGLAGSVDKVANSFKTAARYFIAYRLFHGITRAAREGVSEIINFDQAIQNLAAISGATAGELAVMKEEIITTADRTKYSATEIAEGMVLLTQAGLDAVEATQAIGAVADLASGTLSGLAESSDLVTTALRAFNIDASETRRIADVMANAVNKSKATIDKLRTTFNYVGVSAHQAGLSLEQTAASTMMLYNAGFRASTVGTGLRQVFARLLSPNKKLREAMASYGLELDKSNGKQEWFGDQIAKLAAVMYNFETNTVDMAKAYQLFGLRGAQAAAVLVSNYADLNGVWDDTYRKAMEIGTAQEMMEKQAEGLAFKIKNLTDKLRNLAIVIGEGGLADALGGIVDILRGTIWAFTWVAGTLIGKVVINTVLFTGTVWALVGAGKVLLVLLPKLKAAMAFFGSTAGLVGLAIGALAAVVFSLYSHFKLLKTEASRAAAGNQAIINSISNYKKQLKETTEGSQEYENIIQRLKYEHPELAKEIDGVKDSYVELDKVLDRIIEKQTEEALANTAKVFEKIAPSMEDLFSRYSKYASSTKELPKTFNEWAKSLGYLDTALGNRANVEAYQDIVETFSKTFSGIYKEGGIPAVVEQFKKLRKELVVVGIDAYKVGGAYQQLENDIITALQQGEKDQKAIEERRERIRLAQLQKIADKLPAEWLRIYKSLSNIEKAYFLQAVETTKNGWANIKKIIDSYKDIIYKGNEAAYEADVKAMEKAYFREKLSKYFTEQQKRLRDVPEEWKKAYAGAADEEVFELNKAIEAAKNGWNKQLTWLEANNRKKGESTEAFYIRMEAVRKKYFDKELASYIRKEDAKAYKAEKILQEINEKSARYAGDKYDAEAAKAESFYKQQEQKIDQLIATEKEKDAIRLRNKEVYYERLERMARIHGFGTPEDRRKFEKETGIETDETYGITSVEELAEQWRITGGDLQKYIDQLNALRDEGKISLEEHKRTLERTFAAPGAAFSNGWQKAMDKVRDSSEFLYDLGEALPGKLADGFTDAWGTWMDGTKSAGEAMEDFARSTLKWISQMITRWLVMKAIQGVTGAGGGTIANVAHKGTIVGSSEGIKRRVSHALFNFAPRLHNGINNQLKPNEYPAILQKDEGVFTPAQMKALAGTGGTSINVPVNIGDSEQGDILKRHLPQAIEDAVLKTMKRYIR